MRNKNKVKVVKNIILYIVPSTKHFFMRNTSGLNYLIKKLKKSKVNTFFY